MVNILGRFRGGDMDPDTTVDANWSQPWSVIQIGRRDKQPVVDIGSRHWNQPYIRLCASSNLEVRRKYWLGVCAFIVSLKNCFMVGGDIIGGPSA